MVSERFFIEPLNEIWECIKKHKAGLGFKDLGLLYSIFKEIDKKYYKKIMKEDKET